MNSKTCTHCNTSQPIENFWFNKKKNSYHLNCKKCKYEKSKKYINVTKEKKAEYDKRYRENHKEVLKDKKKQEYAKNKDAYIQRAIKNQNTLIGKLKHNIRTRIGNAIARRSNSSKDLIGCDIDYYIKYLECFFTDEMTWANYGTFWHIDHVKPLCTFDLHKEENQLLAFNWKNTRPLTAYDNLARSKTTDMCDLQQHIQLVDNFLNATSSNCEELLDCRDTKMYWQQCIGQE